MKDTLMQTIVSNLTEISTKCYGTYAAYVADTTLKAIEVHKNKLESAKQEAYNTYIESKKE